MRQWLLLQGHPEQDMNQIYRAVFNKYFVAALMSVII
jgi:hypothetical protein